MRKRPGHRTDVVGTYQAFAYKDSIAASFAKYFGIVSREYSTFADKNAFPIGIRQQIQRLPNIRPEGFEIPIIDANKLRRR